MKLPSLLTCSSVTLVGLVGMATADAVCARNNYALEKKWVVTIAPVPKDQVGPTCHELWKGLKRQWLLCMVMSPHGCEEYYNDKGHLGPVGNGLQWVFTTGLLCNAGMVESAFWEATHNNHGAVDCP
ncbi:hypothetical protein KVR01_007808 [Diaporthe batatas]|uniref:uncharacterized protein n=1 Tax=Diaporthe batatas TaxID=748121 RepID=UPI001D0377BA|nr:uncharacterized protein KVR01_007808 [Diaporthe batatas]KAG8162043.1 hypothetical protein KVR01_007808 [Diaporthe batatas]